MLQQTQVTTVIPYYRRFMQSFPSLRALADATSDAVLAHWSGLGYYARARNLHRAAQEIRDTHHGRFPRDLDTIQTLPGIGRSTAGAIAAFAMQQPTPILDGNVKRVLARCFAIEGWPGNTTVLNQLWDLSERYTPKQHTAAYNQAMMDIGATLCTRGKPRCEQCPVQTHCLAYTQQRIAELPGKKPKTTRKRQSTVMLLVIDQQQRVLLEKRPPVGIWGGLWSFPESSNVSESTSQLNQLGLKTSLIQDWPALLHQFSHFELAILPKVLQLTEPMAPRVMDTQRYIWHDMHAVAPGGMAAPVAMLLGQLKEELLLCPA